MYVRYTLLPWYYRHFVEGIFSWARQHVCIGERGRYTDGSLAAGRGPLSEVPDREIPKVEVGRGADILSSQNLSCLETPATGRL